MTREELFALAKEALAAQRVAAPLTGRLVDALIESLEGVPIDRDHLIFDGDLLEQLAEISGHGRAAARVRDLLQGPLLVIASLGSSSDRRRMADALSAGTARATEGCTCRSCAADRADAAAALDASLSKARAAAQRPVG